MIESGLHRVPLFRRYNREFRMLAANPFLLRPRLAPTLIGARRLLELGLIPYDFPLVEFAF